MRRSKGLNFIPYAVSLDEMEQWQQDRILAQEDDLWKERTVLQMLADMKTDKEKIVLLLQILRDGGYNFDHKSSALALGIQWRWYMRIKQKVKTRLEKYL